MFGPALDAADEAIAISDWTRVAELADSILAVDPTQADAVAFRSLARRQLARHPEVDETERRFLTVMFIDLVGSTTISDQLDPEDFASLLERYHGVGTNAIEAYGGSVVKLLGDGVMAQFGYPQAFEDAPRRACMAALQVIEDIAAIATEIQNQFGVPMDCRIGIHSGNAVVGLIGSAERLDYTAIGDTVNLASRVEGLTKGVARVLVTEATKNAAGDLFDWRECGVFPVKGREHGVRLFEPTAKAVRL